MARPCMYCRENPAELPDRNKQFGRPIKRVCRSCHAGLLRGDLQRILTHMREKRDGKEI